MLFAHGFGCDQNMWRFMTPAFENDYRIVLFDYVGSGMSDHTAYDRARYSSLDGYAQDVLDVCHALELRDVIFVGHSVSSMIGVLAANREPERFERLVLIGPSPRYLNDAPDYVGGFERADIVGLLETMEKNYIGWANFLAPAIMKNPDRPELAAELEASFCSTDPVIAKNFAEATFFADNRGDLAAVEVPSLIMQCSDDMIAPSSGWRLSESGDAGEHARESARNGSLPAHESSRRDHRRHSRVSTNAGEPRASSAQLRDARCERARMTDEARALDPLLDEQPCGFISFADDGTLRVVNRTFLDMLGYARGELIGKHIETISRRRQPDFLSNSLLSRCCGCTVTRTKSFCCCAASKEST